MHRVLIFGGTPLAQRLAYYLKAYSEAKDIETTVIRRELDSTATLHDIQRDVWNTYVADSEGRASLIINAHEQDKLVLCETDPTTAWRSNTRHAAWITYAARTANVPLLLVSSDHVFRGASGPYADDREMATETPINVYGVTKWYAERIAEHLYPKHQPVEYDPSEMLPGTTIVRTSDLYGRDVPESSPAQLTHEERAAEGIEYHTHGVIRDPSKLSPSFIGEVAFLMARNILLSPQSLNHSTIHIAPGGPLFVDWATFLHQMGADVIYQGVGELSNKEKTRANPSAYVHRQGKVRGLTASSGWVLPADPKKSWGDFLSEYRPEGRFQYIRYWDAD
jgi:dTDP-4-dehydrorhamnose reductase